MKKLKAIHIFLVVVFFFFSARTQAVRGGGNLVEATKAGEVSLWMANGETEAERSSDLTEDTQPVENQSLPTMQSQEQHWTPGPPPHPGSAASCPDELGVPS